LNAWPVIIFITFPSSYTGAFIGLFLMRAAFDFFAILGLLSLAGVIINNGIVIYLLMALMWRYAYALVAFYQPVSFIYQEGLASDSRQFFLYYSFVTLTTLGCGDITPLTEKAKSLTILEAFIGQVDLVVVLAWLVGMHVSRKSK
jgi:hypothetical protein